MYAIETLNFVTIQCLIEKKFEIYITIIIMVNITIRLTQNYPYPQSSIFLSWQLAAISCQVHHPGYSAWKLMGMCAAGRWKLDPKRSRKKLNLGPKRSIFVKIGSFCTPKDSFAGGGWEKIPQKDRAGSCQSEKRMSKPRHICITYHIGSTPPGIQHFVGPGEDKQFYFLDQQ